MSVYAKKFEAQPLTDFQLFAGDISFYTGNELPLLATHV